MCNNKSPNTQTNCFVKSKLTATWTSQNIKISKIYKLTCLWLVHHHNIATDNKNIEKKLY